MTLIDLQYIPTLLNAYGIKGATQLTEETEVNYYWISVEKLTLELLFKEACDYACLYPESTGERRVCFLIDGEPATGIAVLLSFPPWDNEVKDNLLNADDSQTLSLVKKLHPFIKATILGDRDNTLKTKNSINGLLRHVYPNVKVRIQSIGNQNPNLVFVNYVQQWLSEGYLATQMDMQALYNQHLRQCRKAIYQVLMTCRRRDPDRYHKIRVDLKVLAKHGLLSAKRSPIVNLSRLNTLDDVEKLRQLDRSLKALIYSQTLSLQQCLNRSSLNQVLTLLGCENIDAIERSLNLWRKNNYEQIKAWESALTKRYQTLQQSWSVYLMDVCRRGFNTLYRFSWVGLAAEVSGLLSNLITKFFAQTRLAKITDYLPTSLQLSQTQCQQLAKYLGGLLGIIGTCAGGWYGLLRILLIAGGGKAFFALFDNIAINDKDAQISSILPGEIGSIRIAALLFATLETYLISEYPTLVIASAAIVGNVTFIEAAKRWLPGLITKSNQPMTEYQALTLVSLALLGQQTGVYLAQYGYQGFNKIMMRKALADEFCAIAAKDGMRECNVDFPIGYHRLSFWSSPTDTVYLGWKQNHKAFETACEVREITLNTRFVMCDIPQEVQECEVSQKYMPLPLLP